MIRNGGMAGSHISHSILNVLERKAHAVAFEEI
jgi:hypothetical protein